MVPSRSVLLTCVVLALVWVGCKGGEATDEPITETAPPVPTGPSILLITLDTTRADRLGCYGNPKGATPVADSLAARGVTFKRAFAHTPLTIPSHVTIFTGQYPDRHGVRDNGDHFLSEDATTLAERFQQAGYKTAASVGAYVTNHKWGFGQGFDAYFDHIPANQDVEGNLWAAERTGDEVAGDLTAWLEANGEQPFFAWMHLFDAHHPYAPPAPYDEQFAKQLYLGEVAFADQQMGVVLDTLEKLGVAANTTVIVVGDHGEGFGSHDELYHGNFVYNATMHVPFIIAPAGGHEPVVVEEPVGLVDVAPTVLTLAGLSADEAAAFEGVDLSPSLDGSVAARRPLYGESMYLRHHYGWSEQRMIVEWPYKYIGSTRPELFNIERDSREITTLVDQEPEVAQRLQAILDERAASAGASAAGTVNADMAARLEALGYLSTSVEVDEGAVLPDPKDKKDVLAKIGEAKGALHSANFAEARKLLLQVVAEEPELIDARGNLAHACAALGDFDTAMAQLDEATRLSPASTHLLAIRASVLFMSGQADRSLEALDEALAIDDQQPRIWTQKLQILFTLRRYPEVVTVADLATARVPEVPSVEGYKGAALVALGKVEEARPYLERATAGGNETRWSRFALGVIADMDGDADASLRHFLAEWSSYPEHVEALNAAVTQMILLQMNAEALEHADIALRALPEHPQMLWARAQAQFNLKQYDDCLQTVDLCLQAHPEQPDCWLLRANGLSKLDRRDEAEAAFEKAVELAKEQTPGASVEGVRRFRIVEE